MCFPFNNTKFSDAFLNLFLLMKPWNLHALLLRCQKIKQHSLYNNIPNILNYNQSYSELPKTFLIPMSHNMVRIPNFKNIICILFYSYENLKSYSIFWHLNKHIRKFRAFTKFYFVIVSENSKFEIKYSHKRYTNN